MISEICWAKSNILLKLILSVLYFYVVATKHFKLPFWIQTAFLVGSPAARSLG